MIKLWIKIKRKKRQNLKNKWSKVKKMMSNKIKISQVHHNSNKRVNKLRRKKESWDSFHTVQIMANGERRIDFKITRKYSS